MCGIGWAACMMCMQHEMPDNKGGVISPIKWEGFKNKEFAIICENEKESFFKECMENGIHIFLSDFAKKRNLFICSRRYESRVSEGRFELFALKGWETKPDGMYGKEGLREVRYEKNVLR